MLVTINTDASWDPKLKIAGYAIWIVSDNFRVKVGGVFKDTCRNPHEAEIKAILNALYILGTKEDYISRIIFNTDSTNAIGVLTWDLPHIKKYLGRNNAKHWKPFYKKLNRYKKKITGMPVYEFRHVRAHTGAENARSKVNEWCDKTAKAFLREERRRITT